MADSHHHHKIPTVAVFGNLSPRDFQNLTLNPIESAMKEFVKEEGLKESQTYQDDTMVVLFGTYVPKNTQSFRDGKEMSPEDVESRVSSMLSSIDTRDIIEGISVSIQYVHHAHGHYGEKETPKLESGHYIGLDAFSRTAGSVFGELRQDYNYGQPTVLSHENGFHCNKRALSMHSPNAFIPYARLPDSIDLNMIEKRLHVNGCKRIKEYATVLYQAEYDVQDGAIDEVAAFTELVDLSLNKNIKYNRICVARLH